MNFKKSFNNLVGIFKSKDKKQIGKACLDLVSILFYLLVIKVPFIFIRDLGYDFLNKKIGENILLNIFYWAIEILYILVFIIYGRSMLTKAFNPKNGE